jgi:hypothetical protein
VPTLQFNVDRPDLPELIIVFNILIFSTYLVSRICRMVILYLCIFVIVFHIIDTTRLGLRHLLTGRPIIIIIIIIIITIIPISKLIQGYFCLRVTTNHHYESFLLRYI